MENNNTFIKEQIVNYITHCLGFKPDGNIDSDFFTWSSPISELRIVFYENRECFHHCYYDFSDASKNPIIEGDYLFGTQLRCADEEAIFEIIKQFRNDYIGHNRKMLNVSSNIELKPYTNRYYVIQVFQNNVWSDVIFSRGNILTANKKARHYRNQNNCDTRVVEIQETVSYSYAYEIVDSYNKNDKENKQ